MTDLSLTELALTYMVAYGPLALGIILFSGALGLPLPGTLLVMAAGAFVRQGALEWAATLSLALVGVVVGDTVSFGLGRYAQAWIPPRMANSPAWTTATQSFKSQAGIAVYLTRFLFTPLAIPTNLIAGSSGYGFWRFLSFDFLGELTWLGLYGAIGYIFGSQWDVVADFVGDFSGLLAGVAFLVLGVYFYRRWQIRRAASPARRNGP